LTLLREIILQKFHYKLFTKGIDVNFFRKPQLDIILHNNDKINYVQVEMLSNVFVFEVLLLIFILKSHQNFLRSLLKRIFTRYSR